MDAPHGSYLVSGEAQACVFGPCLSGRAEISNVGVAGCIQVGSTYTDYGVLVIPLDGSAPTWAKSTRSWRASATDGAPRRTSWELVRLLELSASSRANCGCGAARGRTTAPAGRAGHAGGRPSHPRERRAPEGSPARTGRATITSPAHARGVLRRVASRLPRTRQTGRPTSSCSHPAAGRWTVVRAGSSGSIPVRMERARFRRSRRSRRVCSASGGRAPSASPTRFPPERRCGSWSTGRERCTPSPREFAATGARSCPGSPAAAGTGSSARRSVSGRRAGPAACGRCRRSSPGGASRS